MLGSDIESVLSSKSSGEDLSFRVSTSTIYIVRTWKKIVMNSALSLPHADSTYSALEGA